MARLRAVVVIQAPGLAGSPSRGQRSMADDEGVLDGVLGDVPVADLADERRDRPPRLLAEQAVDELRRDVVGHASGGGGSSQERRRRWPRAPRRRAG